MASQNLRAGADHKRISFAPSPRAISSACSANRGAILTATRKPLLFKRSILPPVARAILRCFAEQKIDDAAKSTVKGAADTAGQAAGAVGHAAASVAEAAKSAAEATGHAAKS